MEHGPHLNRIVELPLENFHYIQSSNNDTSVSWWSLAWRFEMVFHVDRTFAEVLSFCISVLHQFTISTIHSLQGVPLIL